jgi:proline iminopeptidase
MYPPLEPFDAGYLDVSDGNAVYWETSGNPRGKPAVYFHGGPGSGAGTGYRRWFNAATHLIVSFDQRGCGRSRPLVSEPAANLATNTTQALLSDIESLREHLAIERWLVTGASWGTTLALAYAQAHPSRVAGLVLFAVTTTSADEVAWITESMGRVFPREWDEFEAASGRAPGQRLIDAYYALITHPEPQVRMDAARAWCAWEDTHVSLDPRHTPDPRYQDALFRQVFATLVIHYWKHAAFVPPLVEDMARIADVPGVLIHGRLDVSSPLVTAWRLHKAWPASELIVVDDEGHGGGAMLTEVVRAIAKFS